VRGLTCQPIPRPGLARGIGDVDIAAEPDDIVEAQIIKKREQIVVAETPVGEDRDGTTGRHEFLQPPQAGILEVVPLLRKFVFPDCQSQQWRGPAMPSHKIEGERRLSVAIEVGPIHGDDDFLARADLMRNPAGKAVPHVDIMVAEKTVNLLDQGNRT
jgi:hypothetical protein